MGNAEGPKPPPSAAGGVLPAVASAAVPGLGQLINGQGDKALVLFLAWFGAGLGVLGAVPVGGAWAGAAAAATWLYSAVDACAIGRKKG